MGKTEKNDNNKLNKFKKAFDSGNFSQVIQTFQTLEVDKLPPKVQSESFYMYGIALNKTGNRRLAVKTMKEALSFNPHYAIALDALGDLMAEGGHHHAAISQYRAAVKADPNYWKPYYHWGYLLKKMGSPKAALRKFREAIEKNPENVESYTHAGDCALQLERQTTALAFYNKAREIGGDTSEVLSRIGNTQLILGDRESALEAYKLSVAKDPLDGAGYENWGLLLQREEKIEEAAAKYEQGLIHAPDSPTLLLRHGEVLAQMGKFNEALIPLQKSYEILIVKIEGEWGIQWAPVLADCAYTLGYCYAQLEEESKAKEFFKVALRYSPNHYNALQQLAMLGGVYREHHFIWEFVVQGKVETKQGIVKGLRAYRVAALTMEEALNYVRQSEEEIQDPRETKDVGRSEQVASYAGVLARGSLFLLANPK